VSGGRIYDSTYLQSLAEAKAALGDDAPRDVVEKLAQTYTKRRRNIEQTALTEEDALEQGLITLEQAAELSGKTQKALRWHVKSGKLPEVWIGSAAHVREVDVAALARPEGYISIAEIAEAEGIATSTVRWRLKRGHWSDVPWIRHGKEALVKVEDYECARTREPVMA
jgi:hypothetical protein